ncbi:MAG TPA: hypothetical protein PKC40_00435 [Saprospiraceae bacterium]|nr:hypothetical protein [Saprospiraceae bacterium]
MKKFVQFFAIALVVFTLALVGCKNPSEGTQDAATEPATEQTAPATEASPAPAEGQATDPAAQPAEGTEQQGEEK